MLHQGRADIPRSEVPKLKALLEQFEVQDIETAMLLTEHLADYILMPNLSSPQEAALDQLCFIMNREEAVRLIPYVNLFNYGETVIHADNAASHPMACCTARTMNQCSHPYSKSRKRR